MKESYIEGVATHDDPESCAGVREDIGEALIGASTGRTIEPRKYESQVPTPFSNAEGHTRSSDHSEVLRDLAGSENPSMCRNSVRENREIWASSPEVWRNAPKRPKVVQR